MNKKTVVITEATAGIGRATALHCASLARATASRPMDATSPPSTRCVSN